MRTPAQQNASRTNGAKSRGPVTAAGKARVSQNGTTHGVYSKRVVLAGEDPADYNDLHHSLILAWGPVNDYEANLITDIAEARWRLARFTTLETAALDLQVDMMRPALAEEWPDVDAPTRHVLAFNELITSNRSLEVLQTAIRHQHRIIDRATSQLIKLRKMRPDLGPATTPTTATPEDADSTTVSVTPAQLAEMIEAAVRQRLAAATTAEPAPAPAALQNTESKPEPAGEHTKNHESKPGTDPRPTPETPQQTAADPVEPPQTRPNPLREPAETGERDLPRAA